MEARYLSVYVVGDVQVNSNMFSDWWERFFLFFFLDLLQDAVDGSTCLFVPNAIFKRWFC